MDNLLTPEALIRVPVAIIFVLFLVLWFKNQREERESRMAETRAVADGLRVTAEAVASMNASVAALAQSVATMEGAVQANTREVARGSRRGE